LVDISPKILGLVYSW